MTRCSDVRCPLQHGESATRGAILARIGGGMVIAVLAVALGSWAFAPGTAGQADGNSDTGGGFSSARPVESGDNWFARIFGAKPKEVARGPADPMFSSAPDPRAGQRVQSFDCNSVGNVARQLVCTRWDLATADYNLTLAYRSALEKSDRPAALRRAYAEWLRELDRLGDNREAILAHYAKLRAELTGA